MNPEQLIAHFDRVSEAPDAILQLRGFILDLSVRGKLVDQDPNDEPGTELLKRIRAEKIRLVTAGDMRRQTELPPVEDAEIPFKIPRTWHWVRLINVLTKLTDGTHHSPTNFAEGAFKYVTAKNIKTEGISLVDISYVTAEVHHEIYARCNPEKGDILYIKDGATTGVVTINDLREPFSMLSSVALLKLSVGVYNRLLVEFLRSPFFYQQMRSFMKGAAITRVTLKRMAPAIIPLPPLAEQHRIVAKVDELMALCDRFEASQAERENRRSTLVAASLYHLNNDANAETFRKPAHFYINHLSRFTVRTEHIKQLRQTILNLAVRGRLVPQDLHDEPASEQLDRIHADKARLVKEGKIKREKPLAGVAKDEEPFVIPARWEWVRLGTLTQLITKGSSPRWQGVQYVSKEHGVLFVTSENVGNYRLRKMNEPKYVEKHFNEIESRSILQFGDILMNLVGASIGRTAIYDLSDNANINQAVALVRLLRGEVLCVNYLLHYFNSPLAVQYMLASRVVTAQPNMSLTDAREFPVPIPPLAEQQRIVAKVDELMAVCGRLEAQLATAKTESRRLLQAVFHHALHSKVHCETLCNSWDDHSRRM